MSRAHRLLKRLEWVCRHSVLYCEICYKRAEDGHSPDCELAAELAKIPEPDPLNEIKALRLENAKLRGQLIMRGGREHLIKSGGIE